MKLGARFTDNDNETPWAGIGGFLGAEYGSTGNNNRHQYPGGIGVDKKYHDQATEKVEIL